MRTTTRVCPARSLATCDGMQQHHVLVEPCWWLRGRSASLYQCGIYRVNTVLEIRVSSSHEGLVYSEMVTDVEAARDLARTCHTRMLATGCFDPLWT